MNKMRKLGFGVPNFGANQLAYQLIINCNEYLKENYKSDIIGFYENLNKYSINPNFSCMHAAELWGYDGPVVACNLNMANDILKIPTIPRKFFYVWDLEWTTMEDKEYGKLKEVYSNPELTLITRNIDYAEIIENMWNVRVSYIIPNLDIERIASIAWNRN